jgi:hypothetical protein
VLVLVTALLVLVGLVLLILGFAHSALSLIYASIGCTAAAGLVLIYLGRANRRKSVRLAHDEAALATRASSPEAPPEGLVDDTSPAPDLTETAGLDDHFDPAQPQPVAAAAPPAAPAPSTAPTEDSADAAAANPDAPTPVAGDGAAWPAGDGAAFPTGEAAFPIKNYDELRVGEILPLLRGLEPDELEEVRDRESAGKSRGVILRRVEELLASDATKERATEETPPNL